MIQMILEITAIKLIKTYDHLRFKDQIARGLNLIIRQEK